MRQTEASDASKPAAAEQKVKLEEAEWDNESLGSLDEELEA